MLSLCFPRLCVAVQWMSPLWTAGPYPLCSKMSSGLVCGEKFPEKASLSPKRLRNVGTSLLSLKWSSLKGFPRRQEPFLSRFFQYSQPVFPKDWPGTFPELKDFQTIPPAVHLKGRVQGWLLYYWMFSREYIIIFQKKKSHDHPNRCRQSIWQNLIPFQDKSSQQNRYV